MIVGIDINRDEFRQPLTDIAGDGSPAFSPDGRFIAVSPDGSRIAFLTDRTDSWEVWVMTADGSNRQPLFSDEINDQLEITYNFVDEKTLSWR